MQFRTKLAIAALALVVAVACNGDSPTAPNPPSQPPPSPAPITYDIAVAVRSAESGNGIDAATILILDGAFANQSFTTADDGMITLTGAQGNMNVEASHADFFAQRKGVGPPASSGGTQMLTFDLEPRPTGGPPGAPPTMFGPGQHLVGADIAPGRYFSDPMDGCFWERLAGFSGSLADVLANEFIGFDSRQEIVDILASDTAFGTDAECGTWFSTPRHGPQTGISPGAWLVGNQVAPGTYESSVQAGCFWERLSGFTGELDDTIANDFVNAGGTRRVTIVPGDVGFSSDAECGTWQRVNAAVDAFAPRHHTQSMVDKQRNRELNRQGGGR